MYFMTLKESYYWIRQLLIRQLEIMWKHSLPNIQSTASFTPQFLRNDVGVPQIPLKGSRSGKVLRCSRCKCPSNTLDLQQYSLFNNQQSTFNNPRFSTMFPSLLHSILRTSLFKIEWIFGQILFFCCPSISPLRTHLLDIRDCCRVCILSNIRRKDRRDIDGTLGMSALRFNGIALCVAKPSESSAVACRHNILICSFFNHKLISLHLRISTFV